MFEETLKVIIAADEIVQSEALQPELDVRGTSATIRLQAVPSGAPRRMLLLSRRA